MSFNAGAVEATLGGNFRPAGFMAFDSAMKRAKGSMDDVERKGGALGKSMALVGKATAAVAAGGIAAFTLALVKSAGAAGKFEAKMNNVNTIAKISDKALKTLGDQVQKLAVKTGQMPTDLADGLYDIVSSGFVADDALKILEKSSVAASAGLTTTATATKAVVSVLNAYQLGADDAGKVSDTLFGIVDKGVITFEELASQIGDLLPYAPKLGLSLNDLGGAIATITKGGVPATETMTQIKGAMIAFLSPSEQMAAAVRKAGFATGEALVKSKGLQGALEAVEGTTDGTATAMRGLFPEIRGLSAALALTGDKSKAANADLKAMADTAGMTEAAFKKQSKGYEFAKKQFSAALNVAGIQLGTGLLPGLTEGVKDFSAAVEEMADSGQLEKFGEDLGGVLSDLGKNLPLIIDSLSGIGEGIGDAFSIGGAVLGEFYREVGLIVDGILLLVKAWNAIPTSMDIPTDGLEQFRDELQATEDVLRGVKVKVGDKLVLKADAAQAREELESVEKAATTKAKVIEITASTAPAEEKIKALIKLGIPPKRAEVIVRTEQAAAALRSIGSLTLQEKVLKILGKDISAEAKVKQIRALGIKEKTARILGENGDALVKIDTVRSNLAGLDGKTATVRINVVKTGADFTAGAVAGALGGKPRKRAAGRGSDGAERALVAEGRGGELVGNPVDGWSWVTQPTVMDLGAGDSVIPSDPAYSTRALGLMFAAMGVPGYAKGKAPAKPKKPLPIPEAVSVGAVPEDELGKKRDDAREAYQKRKERVRDLGVDIREQREKVRDAKPGKARNAARRKLDDLEEDRRRYEKGGKGLQSLAKLREEWRFLERQFAALKRTNREIDRLNKVQETDRTKMSTAAKQGNEGAWDTARKHRNTTLATLRDMLAKATNLAKPGTAIAAELEGQLATIEGELADAGGEAFERAETPAQVAAREAAERLAESGMTDEERARLADLQAGQSLAALTAGTGDDQAAATGIEGFLSGILGAVMSDPSRGGSASVRDIADQLRQARDNVSSFTGGGATNANPDVQAQLDQERARRETAERSAQISERALSVFSGAGDIGQARIVQNVYTLLPGDSRTLAAVADASNAGNDQQPSVTSPRTFLGL